MKISVKTVNNKHFNLDVSSKEKVVNVKRQIEIRETFPISQQILTHQGRVLNDDTTLHDNKIFENGSLVIMVIKPRLPSSTPSISSTSRPAQFQAFERVVQASSQLLQPSLQELGKQNSQLDVQPNENNHDIIHLINEPGGESDDGAVPPAAASQLTAPSPEAAVNPADPYWQAASNLVAGKSLKRNFEELMDKITAAEVAMQKAFPEAPSQAAGPSSAPAPALTTATEPVHPVVGPNAASLRFPQGMPGISDAGGGGGAFDFLRENVQFQAFKREVQASPQLFQPFLQELEKQNPQLVRLINENNPDYVNLINEPGSEGENDDGFAWSREDWEAINRIEARGSDRSLAIGIFLAFDKNEKETTEYLVKNDLLDSFYDHP